MVDLDAALGPEVDMLDPRTAEDAIRAPVLGSASIPLAELPVRTHELPAKNRLIRVVDVDQTGREAVDWLRAHGRQAECVSNVQGGRTEKARLWAPNPFLMECVRGLKPGRACDLGCGSGREAVALAGLGWDVCAIDLLPDALDKGRDLARRTLGAKADRTEWSARDLAAGLPGGPFDLIADLFFFDRACVASIPAILAPNGRAVIEAFTRTQRRLRGKPGPARVTDGEEVRRLVDPLEIAHCDEGERGDRHTVRVLAVSLSAT